MLRFFSGSSNNINSKKAITECIEKAFSGEPDLNCELIIIYSQMGHNFNDLMDQAHVLSPRAEIIGCTCGGIIGTEGPDESMKALAIMAVKGPKDEFAVASLDASDYKDPFSYGNAITKMLNIRGQDFNMIITNPSFFITTTPFLSGIESVLGSDMPIIGGLSFDGKMISDFQFYNGKIFEKSAIIIGFADQTLEMKYIYNNGLEAVGFPLVITRAEGTKILELDGRNPWEILTEKLGIKEWKVEVAHMSVLVMKADKEFSDEYGSNNRVVAGLIPDTEGNINSLIPLKTGTKLWLTRRNEEKIFQGIDWVIESVNHKLNGKIPVAVFHADCQARGRYFLNRFMEGQIIKKIQSPIIKDDNTLPWLGMYAGGEIAHIGSRNMAQAFSTSLYILLRKDI